MQMDHANATADVAPPWNVWNVGGGGAARLRGLTIDVNPLISMLSVCKLNVYKNPRFSTNLLNYFLRC